MDKFWRGVLITIVGILAIAFYIGLLIGALYLGEYLYNDFGIGGLLLVCTLLLIGVIGTHNDK